MLSGKAPYEGSNFMEILHKKATTMPDALSTFRNDVPPELEALIVRALSREPGNRPRSMDEMGRELTALANTLFPGFADGAVRRVREVPAHRRAGRVAGRGRAGQRTLRAHAAEVALPVGRRGRGRGAGALRRVPGHQRGAAPPPPAPPGRRRAARCAAPARRGASACPIPTPPPAPAVAAAPEKDPDEAEPAKDDTARDDDTDTEAATKKARPAAAAAPSAADNRRLLQDAERLLHAERFAEAQALFEKVGKSKHDRRAALLGMAEIAFQEKNYAQAVESAERAVDRGGGVKAHVLLGDAHFRLGQYKEAAQAYADALKLDPENASAKTGLALAQKRM